MFLGLRRIACENGHKESDRQRRLLKYEKTGISKRYAWKSLPEKCTSVFFPGCTLPGTRPKRTLQLYSFLQNRDPSLGLILDCCCKPSHDLGRQQLFENRFSSLNRKLTASGIKRIITACPNCHKVFTQYGKDVEVTTVYEYMATENFIGKGRIGGIVTLHDPCVTRDNCGIHDAVRNLIRAQGLTIKEMKHTKGQTLCCGNGGAVSRDLTQGWTESRKKEADGRPVLTYCAGCADRLGRSTPTFHLIDLLFEPERTINGKIKVFRAPFTYVNRLWIKRTLQRRNMNNSPL
jgi:Fe-S oxidoreductase